MIFKAIGVITVVGLAWWGVISIAMALGAPLADCIGFSVILGFLVLLTSPAWVTALWP